MTAWFGIRGIGSLYYFFFAVSHGVSRTLAEELLPIVLTVVATPYENDRARERAMKVAPAVLRVETAPPPWSRRLFNGLAQLIVQSTGEPGPIRITATSPGLSPTELTLATEARPGLR